MSRPCLPAVVAALTLCALPRAVGADAIDGDWCYRGGRHLSIEGPDIKTPGGTRMKGDYDRHGFAYVIPPGEPGAGRPVTMVLQDDDNMTLRIGDAAPQQWVRCPAPTS